MALDLPALDRPATASSRPSSGGNCPGLATLLRNWTSGNWLKCRRVCKAEGQCTIDRFSSPSFWESYGHMRIAATALLTLGLLAGNARAAETAAPLAGDAEAGATKAATCTARSE